MKENFITFKKESVQPANAFASATDRIFNEEDIKNGRLVVGTFGNGKYIAMGWLRGMSQDKETGEVLYEIVNALEDEVTTYIKDARRVNSCSVPVFAASCTANTAPFIGRPVACNGEKAILYTEDCDEVANTEFIYRLKPLFEETK